MKTSQFKFICAIAGLVATTRGAWCQQSANTSPPFAGLYCFGFSWTDTQEKYRSCNGSMWPEFMSTNLGLAYLPAHNLARGGSTTDDTLGQVNGLGSLREPQRNLYVVWVAAGDVVLGVGGITWTNDTAWNSMLQSALKASSNIVQRLYAKGARSVVVQNCLDVSLTPQILQQIGTNTARLAKLKEHIAQFNSDLAGTLQGMGTANLDLRLMLVDTFAHLNDVYANAGT
jgi:phospholipase/lecithinase/hemolysin